jgi:hypothetical protein
MMKRRAEYSVGTIGDWKTRRLLLLGVLATSPAWLWGIFLRSCASGVVAVVNTFARGVLISHTRAFRD